MNCETDQPDELEYGEAPFIPRLPASEAIGMAVFRKLGLVELFDSELTRNRMVSPGRRAMLMVGTSCRTEKRERLCNISDHYRYAPLDRLMGGSFPTSALSGEAFGDFLDDLYDADPCRMYCHIASKVRAYLKIRSYVYNIDFSNTTILSTETEHRSVTVPEDAHHNMFGKSKEGRDDCVQINYSAMVDSEGFVNYLQYHDGNTADCSMMGYVLDFIERTMSDENLVLVADCKMVNLSILDRIEWENNYFVSKCPESFSEHVRDRVVARSISEGVFTEVGSFSKRRKAPIFEACEFRERLENGDSCRFIAFRECNRPHSYSFLKKDGMRRWEKACSGVSRRHYGTLEAAQEEARRITDAMSDTAYAVSVGIEELTKPGKRGRRGRPSSDDPVPEPIRYWKIRPRCEFDEELAEGISTSSDIRVIITNLPESEIENEDPREGATIAQVMRIYFGQWKIEKSFADMKSRVGADRLFVHNENRQEALLTVIGVSVLIRGVIQYTIRSRLPELSGRFPTMTIQRIFRAMQNVNVMEMDVGGRTTVLLDGPPDERELVKAVAEALDLKPADLVCRR